VLDWLEPVWRFEMPVLLLLRQDHLPILIFEEQSAVLHEASGYMCATLVETRSSVCHCEVG